MGSIPEELLLARIRKETAAREAAFAALSSSLEKATAAMDEKIVAAASKLSAKIGSSTVSATAIAGTILRTQVEPGFALAEQVTALEARVVSAETQSVASIEEIRTALANQNQSFAQETLTIRAQFNASSASFQQQITANATAISAVTTRTTTLESTVNNPTTGVAATAARLTTEETTRATADTALASRATTLESTVNDPTTGVAATSARLTTEETTRASADSALSSSISTVSATANTKNRTFTQLSAPTASAVGDLWVDTGNGNALKRWDGSAWVDTSVATGAISAAVTTEATARANADTALATRTTTLESTVNDAVTGVAATSARLTTEESTRATADSALSSSISTVSATANGKNKTFYQSSAPTASAVGDIWVDTNNGNALKRWSGSAWEDTTVAVGAINAAVTVESTARANADTALSTRTTTLESTVNNATTGVAATAARLTTEETTRANADSALSTSISTVSATANLKNRTFTQASPPTASAVGDLWVDTGNGNALKRWDGSAWVDTTVAAGAISAAVTTESTARATADTALASRATALESTVNSATDGNAALKARIAAEETARADADTALSTSISTVSATASGKNKTFYQSSTPTASAAGDLWIDTTNTANAIKRWNGTSWVDTQVAAGAIGAAVAVESSARAAADGNLSGKYSLKVIAGDVVTGMNITSSTGSGTDISDITFQASSFKIYNGSSSVAPFQVVNGQVRVTGSLVISSGDVSGLGTLATQNNVATNQVTGLGTLATQNNVSTNQVTGLGGLATKSSVDLATGDVTNKSLANVDSTANTKLAGIAANADVTLSAINGGLVITSGGLTLNGTPSIKSNNYSPNTAGWAINGDGSVEFASGTFRGSVDVGSGLNRTQINTAGLTVGNVTINGASNQNTIEVGSGQQYKATINGGAAASLFKASYSTLYTQINESGFQLSNGTVTGKIDRSNNRMTIGTTTDHSIVLISNNSERVFIGADGHLKMNGGDIRKVTDDGWTPALNDGNNTIQFKWDGSDLKVKIDTTEFTVTIT